MLPKVGDIHLWKDLKSNDKYCQACRRSSRAMQQRKYCSRPCQLGQGPNTILEITKIKRGILHTGVNFFPCFTFYDQKHGKSTAPVSIHSIPGAVFPLENQHNLWAGTFIGAQRSQGDQVVLKLSAQAPAKNLTVYWFLRVAGHTSLIIWLPEYMVTT